MHMKGENRVDFIQYQRSLNYSRPTIAACLEEVMQKGSEKARRDKVKRTHRMTATLDPRSLKAPCDLFRIQTVNLYLGEISAAV